MILIKHMIRKRPLDELKKKNYRKRKHVYRREMALLNSFNYSSEKICSQRRTIWASIESNVDGLEKN